MSRTEVKSDKLVRREPRWVWDAVSHVAKLPASRRLVQKAIEVSEHPLCSNSQLQAILSVDIGATADILRLANSPYFGVGSQVRTLAMAITVIGHTRLRSLLRHLLAADLFGQLGVEGNLAERVWSLSLAAGTACHAIGGNLFEREADNLMMGGLLHSTGELALLSVLPDAYQKTNDLSTTMPRVQAEREVFEIDSGTVGRWLLEGWHFPEALQQAAAFWRTPLDPSLDRSAQRFVAGIHVGVRLAEGWVAKSEPADAVAEIAPDLLDFLQVTPDRLEPIYQKIGPDIEKLREAFSPRRASA